MNIQQLRYVVETADRGSMTAAATELFVAQPALSRAVRQLERELDVTIFRRAGRGIALTSQGEAFVARARRVLRSIDALRRLSDGDAATTQTGVEAVPRAVALRYARLSGDRNPIHMSWLGARLFGFKRPIAHGMWTKARALARVLPAAPVERVAIDVAFRAPVLLPGRITHFADPVDEGTDFAVRYGAGERLHLIGRLGRDLAFEKGLHAQYQ